MARSESLHSLLLLASLSAAAAGCSLASTSVTTCTSNEECRSVFGVGYGCGDTGYCQQVEPETRCTQTYPGDIFLRPDSYREAILIGSLFDQSLATHRARENAIRLAFRQANEEGGLEGRMFAVVFCTITEDAAFDTLTRTEAAKAMAEHLANDLGAASILGPASSGDTKAVFETPREQDVVFMSPSATSPLLTSLDPVPATDDEPGRLWRTAPPDSVQGQAIAEDMRNLGDGRTETTTRAAVIFEEGAYGESLAQVFEQRFSDLGGTSTILSYSSAAQRDEAITTAAGQNVEEVLFVSSQTQDAIAFLSAAATIPAYQNLRLFLTDSAANADFLEDASPALLPQVRGTRQAPQNEEDDFVFSVFLAAYSAAYGEDAREFSFTANAFDAAWLLAYGTAWATYQTETISGTNIAKGLRQVSDGPTIELRASNWTRLKDRFQAGESVDVLGASGELDYNPDTEEMVAPVETWVIEDGAIKGVRTFVSETK